MVKSAATLMPNTHRVQLQPAFILHSRPFKEHSQLVNCLSLDFGQISGILSGRYNKKKGQSSGWIQPFTPLSLSWSGRTSLVKIHSVEGTRTPYSLTGRALLSALYLNELCIRLIPQYDHYPQLYKAYQHTLQQLHEHPTILEISLRKFEWQLLCQLGYQIELEKTQDTQQPVYENSWYQVDPEKGLIHTAAHSKFTHPPCLFIGKSLIAFHQKKWDNAQTLYDAKRLTRLLLGRLLGPRPLKSRSLFHN